MVLQYIVEVDALFFSLFAQISTIMTGALYSNMVVRFRNHISYLFVQSYFD